MKHLEETLSGLHLFSETDMRCFVMRTLFKRSHECSGIVRKFLSLRQRMMMMEMIEMEALLSVLGPILFSAINPRIWSCWIFTMTRQARGETPHDTWVQNRKTVLKGAQRPAIWQNAHKPQGITHQGTMCPQIKHVSFLDKKS